MATTYEHNKSVFPAYAGVIPTGIRVKPQADGIPRVCGGDPVTAISHNTKR